MKPPRSSSAASVRIDVGQERGPAAVRFELGGRAERVAAVRLDVTHALGVATGIVPPASGGVALDLRALPAGPAELRMTPVLTNGRDGRSVATGFGVPGRPGEAPEIASFQARDRQVRVPGKGSTVLPRFRLAFREPGAPASAVHLELTRPDGSVAYEHVPAPAGGAGALRPFALAADTAPGTYTVRAALVDVDGNAGAFATARFAVGDRGIAPPAIARAAWRKGGRIVVRGSGLDAPGVVALLDGAPAPIAEVADDQLVVVADIAQPVRLEIQTEHGAAVAPRSVGPAPGIEILPAGAVVAEGGSAQLHAIVRGVAGAEVAWSVDRAPGVAISADGVLSADHGAPDEVVVHARISRTRTSASTRVAVVPPRGRGITIGARGGTTTGAGGAVLTVPAGAVAAPVELKADARRSRLVQRGLVVAAEVALTPVELAAPATLEVPLRVRVDPGTQVDVMHKIGDAWEPAGHATVDPTGFGVSIDLHEVPGGIRVVTKWPHHHGAQQLSAAPTIATINETPVEEGDTVPLFVTGTNFVPGRTTVSVVRNGSVDARVETRGVVIRQDGTALGVTIAIGPLGELAEGMLSDHLLRVETPAGRAEFPLPILGHNELIVTAGQTVTITTPQRLSQLRVDAGGTLRVASTVPPLLIAVLGEATIDGTVSVAAAAGAGGARGVDGGAGGAGGAGASPFGVAPGGSGGMGGPDGNAAGAAGGAGAAPPSTMPTVPGARAGAGGAGGGAGGGGFWPHAGGDGAKGLTAPNPRIPGFQAHSGIAPAPGLGAGGGGGGGGGGEGWVFKAVGGGGGGGGAGGGGVAIAAGGAFRLRGIVLANGGDGGRGGTAGAGPPDIWTLITAGQGGGGGAGAGGTILLQGISDSWGATVLAVSGKPGSTPSATVQVEPRTELQQAIARDPSGDIRADGAIIGLAKPVATQGPDLGYLRELVTTQNSIDLMGLNATHLRVSGAFGSTRRAIRWSQNAGLNAETVACAATVPLHEGFNSVIAEFVFDTMGLPETSPALDALVLMRSAAVRARKLLFIDHTLAYYEFTATITPAALSVATERSADLTVAVVASQPTPLVWSVPSGADYGTVAAQPNGARYTAPSRAPASPTSVMVASSLAPDRTASATVTILPGVSTSAVAASGTPKTAVLPSANCGQQITIDIPPAAFALTGQAFTQAGVEFPRLMAQGGMCVRDVLPVAPVLAPGLQSLTVEVPACADPGGWVRVPGHGSARLQIVPLITGLAGDRAANPDYTINGSGFACGDTQVLVNGVAEPAASILSLTCGSIHMAQWPNHGTSIIVRTSGGDSAPFLVP